MLGECFGEAWETWRGLFYPCSPLWGSLGGAWGGLGNAWEYFRVARGRLGKAWGMLGECFGEAWGGLGRLGEREAWGRLGECLGNASGLLGRLGEACSIDARPLWGSLGGLGELGECLGPQNHHQNEDHPMSQLHLCPSLLQMREHSCKSE